MKNKTKRLLILILGLILLIATLFILTGIPVSFFGLIYLALTIVETPKNLIATAILTLCFGLVFGFIARRFKDD